MNTARYTYASASHAAPVNLTAARHFRAFQGVRKFAAFGETHGFFGSELRVLLGIYIGPHRIAISNERLLACENGEVRFRWRDYAHGNKVKVMRLPLEEFIRRFLLHVLPKGFMRIRHYGLLANRHRTEHLTACRVALDAPIPAPAEPETVEAFLSRVLGTDANRCPHWAQGRLCPVKRLPPLPRATGPPFLRWAA